MAIILSDGGPQFFPKLTDEQKRDGVVCPCCDNYAKVYRRRINKSMAKSLIKMFQIAGYDPVHVPSQIGSRSREEAKLRYWGLVYDMYNERPDGGKAGWWRVTKRGYRFLSGDLAVVKYALVYGSQVIGYEGELITIHDALRHPFDLAELMERDAQDQAQ